MLDRIFVHNWMALPATTRERLRELLHIPKTGQTEVKSEGGNPSVLVTDGVTVDDLATITVKLLQEFTSSDETEFPRLWNIAVQKADMTLSEIVADLGAGDNGSDNAVKDEESISEESPKE